MSFLIHITHVVIVVCKVVIPFTLITTGSGLKQLLRHYFNSYSVGAW